MTLLLLHSEFSYMRKIWFSYLSLFISVYIIFLLRNLRCIKSGIYKLKKPWVSGTWDAWFFLTMLKSGKFGVQNASVSNISLIQEHIPNPGTYSRSRNTPPCSPGIHSRLRSCNIHGRAQSWPRNLFLIGEHPVPKPYFRSRIILERPSVCEVYLAHGWSVFIPKLVYKRTAKTQCRKFETNIPRKGIVRPQFLCREGFIFLPCNN